MNEALVRLWNETVRPDDTVVYLGDFSMNPHVGAKYAKRLNGRKLIWTSGNHDRCWNGKDTWINFYKQEYGFEYVYPRGIHPRLILYWNDGEDRIALHVRLSHLPYDVYDGRYEQYLPVEDGSGIDILAHGHRHSKPEDAISIAKNGKFCIDVGVDCNNYKPISEHDIVRKFVEYKTNGK